MILLIDTSQESGTTALSKGGEILFSEENKIAKEHASWLHLAIGRILSDAKKTVRDLEAVAVISGPGSYTGLRVGMAAAKGFCYALKIPLITQNTLRVMAESMISPALEKQALICPLIDARRDEVFTALFKLNGERSTLNAERSTLNAERSTLNAERSTLNAERSTLNAERSTLNAERLTPNAKPPNPHSAEQAANRQPSTDNLPTANRQPSTPHSAGQAVNELIEVKTPQALILDKTAFEYELANDPIIFFGSGAEKWKKITDSSHALFMPQPNLLQAFARLAQSDFDSKIWADPVYAEPVYLKEFFSY